DNMPAKDIATLQRARTQNQAVAAYHDKKFNSAPYRFTLPALTGLVRAAGATAAIVAGSSPSRDGIKGSAFLISRDTLLTAKHVFDAALGADLTAFFPGDPNGYQVDSRPVGVLPDIDVVVLRLSRSRNAKALGNQPDPLVLDD